MGETEQVITRASGPRFILEANKRKASTYIFPILIGLVGAAILCALGVWQLQRLAWKENILAGIEARLAAPLIPLPEAPDPEKDNYVGVEVGGKIVGDELHVLTSLAPTGPGFRVIRTMETLGGPKILVDLGYVPETAKLEKREPGAIFIEGNLIWPDETDFFTPQPNPVRNIWFARDVARMSETLGTEPIMVAARTIIPEMSTVPMPVTVNIPNNHKEYAITWFGLMIVWIVMTAFLLWRIKREDA